VSPNGSEVKIRLASNPSHLESVDPVVEGMARALQDKMHDEARDNVIPILIHGDEIIRLVLPQSPKKLEAVPMRRILHE